MSAGIVSEEIVSTAPVGARPVGAGKDSTVPDGDAPDGDPFSASIDFRVFLGKEPAGNDPVLMTAHEGPPDMEKHSAFARVQVLKNLLLHVSIRRRRLVALRAEKDMRVVSQPDVDPGIVFRVFNS